MSMLIAFAISIALSFVTYMLQPKPKKPAPGIVEDSSVPLAKASDPIPKIYGTCYIKSSNVVWYGDLRTTPIKKKGGK